MSREVPKLIIKSDDHWITLSEHLQAKALVREAASGKHTCKDCPKPVSKNKWRCADCFTKYLEAKERAESKIIIPSSVTL